MAIKDVPYIVVSRLPIYLRALTLLAEEGQEITSSQELGQKLGLSPAQIRKDLSHFGEFGKQGTGYEIEYLQQQLRLILNASGKWQMILIGAGDLGRAIVLHYGGFEKRGFNIAAVFERDPRKIGQKLGPFEILNSQLIPQYMREAGIKIAIIAVPASEAQDVAENLIEAGIKAILNYAPITLSVPPEVKVQYMDPVIYLQRMTYYLE
ncbi:MAG: redox-sensing transcriptional repressor Rex [Anaerolineales bacterium]|nr:redox-sensing transcriptional repressor Rex [Anaerolineales bacterium]